MDEHCVSYNCDFVRTLSCQYFVQTLVVIKLCTHSEFEIVEIDRHVLLGLTQRLVLKPCA